MASYNVIMTPYILNHFIAINLLTLVVSEIKLLTKSFQKRVS